jgi:putative membrane protein
MNPARTVALAALVSLASPASAFAQGSDPATSASAQNMDAEQSGHGMSAIAFVRQAGQDGLTEISMAHLALANSKNGDVRQFATKMLQDHGKSDAELQQLAAGRRLQVPAAVDAVHQSMIDQLAGKTGVDFDAAYGAQMETAHDKAIALFQAAASSTDPQIAGFAKDSLPTLAEHKRMADDLKVKIKIAAADSSVTSANQ